LEVSLLSLVLLAEARENGAAPVDDIDGGGFDAGLAIEIGLHVVEDLLEADYDCEKVALGLNVSQVVLDEGAAILGEGLVLMGEAL